MPELRCQTVDDHYLLRDGASGIFLAASQFPKNRETRPPKVAELLPHANELDPKFKYLLSAPAADPDGRPTFIRFSRKTKQQYVQSELDGKPTGWQAFYRNGQWVESKAPPAKKGAGASRPAYGGKRAKAPHYGEGRRRMRERTMTEFQPGILPRGQRPPYLP